MYQSDSTTPRRPRRASATQTRTILILGAGLTCSGVAWGSQVPPDDALDALIGRLINNAASSGVRQADARSEVPTDVSTAATAGWQAGEQFDTAPPARAEQLPPAPAIAEARSPQGERDAVPEATVVAATVHASANATAAAAGTTSPTTAVVASTSTRVATPDARAIAKDKPGTAVLPAPDSVADTHIRRALAAESTAPSPAPITNSERGAAGPARTQMAGWKPVSHDKLDELRGGFDAGGLQVSFGIDRAVYVNGTLVVQTSLTIPDIRAITVEQASRLAAAVQTATNAGAVAQSAVSSGLASAGIGTSSPGAPGTSSATAGSASASSSASAGQAGSSSASAGQASSASLPTTVVGTTTGAVSTNGLLALVQNGSGNSALAGAQGNGLANTPATIIQNSLNNQSIQNLTTINTSVNTLAAFRAQVAASTLNSVLLRSAAMR